MKLHPTARLLVIAAFLFAMQSTVSVLSHIHADEPANSPVIPLAVSEGDPDADTLVLLVGKEISVCKLPGRNRIERVANLLNDELNTKNLDAFRRRAKAIGSNAPEVRAMTSFGAYHLLDAWGKPGSNREALSLSRGWRHEDGSVDFVTYIQMNPRRITRRIALHQESVWHTASTRAFRIRGTRANFPSLSESTDGREPSHGPNVDGHISGIRLDSYLGTIEDLGSFSIGIEFGFVQFDRVGWLPKLECHFRVKLDWYAIAGFYVEWEFDPLRSMFAKRVIVSF